MKYQVFNQSGELVARTPFATVAALLVLALSDGEADGASIRDGKTSKNELFSYRTNAAPQSAAEIAKVIADNERLLPGYRKHCSWSYAQGQTAELAAT